MLFDNFIFTIEMIGTIAFAVSGALSGVSKRLDILGITVLGCVTAIGGGIMRDILLGSFPPAAFTDPVYVSAAIATSVVIFIFAYLNEETFSRAMDKLKSAINIFDAIGLGVFAVSGTEVALSYGFSENAFLSVFVGILTGVGGGVLRDLMVCEIPSVLRKKIYAVAAAAGSVSYYLILKAGALGTIAMLCGIGLTIAVRILASHFEWALPRIK